MYRQNNEDCVFGGGCYCQLYDFNKIDISICSSCNNFVPYPDLECSEMFDYDNHCWIDNADIEK